MRQFLKGIRHKTKGGDKRSSPVNSPPSPDLKQCKESSSAVAKTLDPTYPPDKLLRQKQQNGDSGSKDLWQVAYESEKLSDEDRQNLSPTQATTESFCVDGHGHRFKTLQLIDEVVQLTEKQYEDYRRGGGGWNISRGAGKEDIKLRDVGQRILDATLSFKDIISKVAVFDPTGHASSVWGIVSLGLTMTQNHINIRNALFKSSEFLTDVLARCAFIEKEHYYKGQFETKNELEKAIVQVYVGILQYTAQVHAMQKAGAGLKTLESVSEVTDHPIIQIQSYIENDERKLHHWVDRDQHLKQSKQAENILAGIDKIFISIRDLHQKLDLHNLQNAEGASFDSYKDQHEDECLSGTRKELLQQIFDWGSSSQGQCIFWLNGMAGTGKSTVSRSVAKHFKERGELGASFFFKRGEGDRGNATRFFSTITRQLITTFPWLTDSVSQAIEADPVISTKSLSEQFDKLLLQPLCSLNWNQFPRHMVVVVDALDECDGEKDIQLILQLLPKIQQSTSVHLHIFLTSRPEIPIHLGFRKIEENDHRDFILHKDVPEEVINSDIFLFLNDRLLKTRKERSLSPDWPGDEKIQILVKRAQPLFISAATLCRFIGDKSWDPEERLDAILADQMNYVSKMDSTYLPILKQLLTGQDKQESIQLIQEFKDIVGIIILLATPLSLNALAGLLDVKERKISLRLNPLHSVLSIPDNPSLPVRPLHLSFRDFLLDSEKKNQISKKSEPEKNDGEKLFCSFWIDEKEMHDKITVQCLKVMRRHLMMNICRLESEGIQRTEIDRDSINRFIPPELQYSCRYWTQHLAQGKDLTSKMDNAFSFLQEHLLHWAEVMCILGYASEIVQGIERLQSLVYNNANSELPEFLHDTRRFMMKYRHIADSAPLQLYCSGLIFAPSKSIARETFSMKMPEWICRLPTVEEFWNAELETLEGHGDSVNSVAFSQDGRWLASSSGDHTIKLWDPATGALQQTLEGHIGSVNSVAFSQNGQWLASCSRDHTIKLWDPATGALQQTLEGQDGLVYSVAFSQDGQWLASGSYDCTIKLWDPVTGALQQTLEGHDDWVNSVAFSQDGRWLASGSGDRTIKLWNPVTGALQQTLEGHNGLVCSVAFSQDGRWLASSSDDGIIKLWDPVTGALQQTLEGHIGSVNSVAFSQNGQWLVSGSDDRTIKLWNPVTGALQQTLEGHGDWVWSVAFSQDGQWLASGSGDHTIKLWDPLAGALQQTLEGHDGWVRSVAFSQDGRWLASGSDDCTIKLWNPATGALQQTLEGHDGWVRSVAFSQDGRWLASGSDDCTIKLWNPATGALQQTLEGHNSWVRSVAFSQDGRWLASGSHDRTIKLWDPVTGALQQTLEGHDDWVNSVAFSQDGRWLASGSGDRTIKLWDPVTGALQQTLKAQRIISELRFSDDGPYLETDLGTFNIQSLYGTHTPVHTQVRIKVSILNKDWVALQGKKVLWLPPAYRPSCVATRDGKLALGYASGRISFFQFCH